MKTYTLIGVRGKRHESATPGKLGGHRRNKGYGRLDCPSALRWIAKGYYVKHRVFLRTGQLPLLQGTDLGPPV